MVVPRVSAGRYEIAAAMDLPTAKHAELIFGRRVQEDDIVRLFAVPDGWRFQYDEFNGFDETQRTCVDVHAILIAPDGHHGGDMWRRLILTENGTMAVEHSLLEINPAWRRRGVGTAILEGSKPLYKAEKFTEIRVYAVEEGRLTWAARKFDWRDDQQRYKKLNEFKEYLKARGIERVAAFLFAKTATATPGILARAKTEDGVFVGESFLKASTTSGWHGIMRL